MRTERTRWTSAIDEAKHRRCSGVARDHAPGADCCAPVRPPLQGDDCRIGRSSDPLPRAAPLIPPGPHPSRCGGPDEAPTRPGARPGLRAGADSSAAASSLLRVSGPCQVRATPKNSAKQRQLTTSVCAGRSALRPCDQGTRDRSARPYKAEDGGSSPSAPTSKDNILRGCDAPGEGWAPKSVRSPWAVRNASSVRVSAWRRLQARHLPKGAQAQVLPCSGMVWFKAWCFE